MCSLHSIRLLLKIYTKDILATKTTTNNTLQNPTMSPRACDIHKHRKKGVCKFCNTCRLCPPPLSCRHKENHINVKGQKKRKYNPGSPTCTLVSPKKKSKRRKFNNVVKKLIFDNEHDNFEPKTNKEKIQALCVFLGLDPEDIECPTHRYTASSVNDS